MASLATSIDTSLSEHIDSLTLSQSLLDLCPQLGLNPNNSLAHSLFHQGHLALCQLLLVYADLVSQQGLPVRDQCLAVVKVLMDGLEVYSVVFHVLSLGLPGLLRDVLVLVLDEGQGRRN